MQQICDEEMNNDENYPWLVEVGLDYALTVTRADGTVENYRSGHINQYVQNTYGDEQGLLFSSEEEAQAMIAEWKTTIAREGDTYDEVINLTPQPPGCRYNYRSGNRTGQSYGRRTWRQDYKPEPEPSLQRIPKTTWFLF